MIIIYNGKLTKVIMYVNDAACCFLSLHVQNNARRILQVQGKTE